MSKKSYALMVAAAAFLLVAAAQPAVAQTLDNDTDVDEELENETDDLKKVNDTEIEDEVNDTEDLEERNETGEFENETLERNRDRVREHRGSGAQFDARLMTAIKTVDALVELAPNDNVSQRLEKALDILKGVQEDTDTTSLGPGDRNRTMDQEREGKPEDVGGPDQAKQEREGKPEDVGGPDQAKNERGPSEERGNQGSGSQQGPGDRGPSDNGNRPGFVSQFLSGLFG